jgi:hypothetical protein
LSLLLSRLEEGGGAEKHREGGSREEVLADVSSSLLIMGLPK